MSDQDFAVVNGRKWVSRTTADGHVSICSLEFTACLENLEFAPHSVDVVGHVTQWPSREPWFLRTSCQFLLSSLPCSLALSCHLGEGRGVANLG